MTKDYTHITVMENIMVQQQENLQKLNNILQEVENNQEDYQKLLAYYYSEQRNQDLLDDEHNLIPQNLHRGVLSEDEIFDLIGDYRQVAIRMLEVATSILKK